MSEETKSPLLGEHNNHPLITAFNTALKDLYNHVGFREDWVIFPIEDRTLYSWEIDERAKIVRYADTPGNLMDEEAGEYYEDEIYTQRFYQKHVYRGAELTMVFVDTHTDGNKFFAIFRNDLEVRGE